MSFSRDERQEQVYQCFVEESRELLEHLEAGLLQLSQNLSPSLVYSLVRSANSIQVGATSIGMRGVATLAKRLELACRNLCLVDKQAVDITLENLLLQICNYLRLTLSRQAELGQYYDTVLLAEVEPLQAQLEAKLGCSLATGMEHHTAVELDTGLMELILKTEVTQSLEQLAAVLAYSPISTIAQEIQQQTEKLARLGEFINLPELAQIAHRTLAALQAAPEAAESIGKLALQSFQSLHTALLRASNLPLDPQTSSPTQNPDLASAQLTSGLPAHPQSLGQPISAIAAATPPHEHRVSTAGLFVCRVDSLAYITLPLVNLAEILMLKTAQVQQLGKRRFLYWRDRIIPVYCLVELLDTEFLAPVTATKNELRSLLVFRQEHQALALDVKIEQIIVRPELLIHPFPAATLTPGYLYGRIRDDDQRWMLAIDAGILLRKALQSSTTDTIFTRSTLPPSHRFNVAVPPRPTPPPSSAAPTILVVDDSKTVRKLLYLTLYKAGYRVLEAENGLQAIACLQKHSAINLIICDVEMPEMSGFDFLSYHCTGPKHYRIPVIVLSSRGSEQHQQLAMRLGARAYLTKPYTDAELLDTVSSSLALKVNPVK